MQGIKAKRFAKSFENPASNETGGVVRDQGLKKDAMHIPKVE
jgi:hypothetical protein